MTLLNPSSNMGLTPQKWQSNSLGFEISLLPVLLSEMFWPSLTDWCHSLGIQRSVPPMDWCLDNFRWFLTKEINNHFSPEYLSMSDVSHTGGKIQSWRNGHFLVIWLTCVGQMLGNRKTNLINYVGSLWADIRVTAWHENQWIKRISDIQETSGGSLSYFHVSQVLQRPAYLIWILHSWTNISCADHLVPFLSWVLVYFVILMLFNAVTSNFYVAGF